MVTPKRVVETTPLVVAQTERLKRSLEIGSLAEATPATARVTHDAKREFLTMSQKFGRA